MINMPYLTKGESIILLRTLNISITASGEYDDFPKTMETLLRKLMKAVPEYKPYESRSGFDTKLSSLMVKIKKENETTHTSKPNKGNR